MALPSERTHGKRASGAPPGGLEVSREPRLAIVLAVAANGTIGADNALPWRLPADLRRFRALTTGHAVIMGRRTFQSLKKPLENRQNIVVSRDRQFLAPGAEVAHSFEDALARVRMPPPVFCIGGAELYALALPHADVLYLTEIEQSFAGDTRLPPLDRGRWVEIAREPHRTGDGLAFAFVTYARAR